MRLPRRDAPSREDLAAVGVPEGERVLAAARDAAGGWLVATTHALHGLAGGAPHRLEWHRIARATWEEGVLDVRVPRELPLRWRVDVPGRVPDVVRDRVTASIVIDTHARLVGRAGVRIVGRRRPGAEEPDWTLTFDQGLDPADPQVRALADAALADLRRQLGT